MDNARWFRLLGVDYPNEMSSFIALNLVNPYAPMSPTVPNLGQINLSRGKMKNRIKEGAKELIEEYFKKITEIRDELAKQTEGMRTVGFFDQYPKLRKQPYKIMKLLDEYLEEGGKWRLRQ